MSFYLGGNSSLKRDILATLLNSFRAYYKDVFFSRLKSLAQTNVAYMYEEDFEELGRPWQAVPL